MVIAQHLMSFVIWLAAFFLIVSAEELKKTPRPCAEATFQSMRIHDVDVLSVHAEPKLDHITASGHGGQAYAVPDLSFCNVTVQVSHKHANDKVRITIWLPLEAEAWNGRFQATGGAGWATGGFEWMVGPALKDGYATATTDGGYQGDTDDFTWSLHPDNSVSWPLLHNFATRSLADMILVGKKVTEMYYDKKPHHSYFNGCSQGGRQGYMLAQRYPDLLDGILANAPAISLTHLVMGDLWPQIAMKEAKLWMSRCELEFSRYSFVEACDMDDGVPDRIITNPEMCAFNPGTLVGKKIVCEGKETTITKEMVNIIREIQRGPRTPFGAPLWHGLAPGTDASHLANITINDAGVRSGAPFAVSSAFIKHLLLKDPKFNVSSITYADYVALWAQASYEYGWLLDADDTNLSAFQKAGGKLLSWHGTGDSVIPYQNTVNYRKRVEMEMGGPTQVDGFYRFFLAPGVMHCLGGPGAAPSDPMGQLVTWVENDEPPETLEAETTDGEGQRVTRELCRFPKQMRYLGIGDAKRASSWTCESGEDAEEEAAHEGSNGLHNEILDGLKAKLMGLGLPGLRIQ